MKRVGFFVVESEMDVSSESDLPAKTHVSATSHTASAATSCDLNVDVSERKRTFSVSFFPSRSLLYAPRTPSPLGPLGNRDTEYITESLKKKVRLNEK